MGRYSGAQPQSLLIEKSIGAGEYPMASKKRNLFLLFMLLCLILFSIRWFFDLISQAPPIVHESTLLQVKPKPKAADNQSLILRSEQKQQSASDIALKTFQVTDFGAVGDGVHNDTAAIQAAINEASMQGGAKVYLPKGIYILKDSLVVRGDHITLEGAGWETELRIVTHPQRVVTVQDANHCTVRNLQVSLGVTGVERNDQDEGVYVTGASNNFLIENILGNGKGIMVRGEMSQGVIRSNTIRDTLADGIHITNGADSIEILDNNLENTGDDAIAVVSYESNQKLVHNIKIIGNQIKNSKARGIAHVGGDDVTIWSNTIDGTSSSGILVDQDLHFHTHPSYNTSIKDNTISHAGTYGIKRGNQFGIEISEGAFYVAIENNIIQDGVFRGLGIGAKSTKVRFNQVLRNGESGIQIDADQVILEGNQVELNGKYGLYVKGKQGLKILDNVWTNNNTIGQPAIDNIMVMDSDFTEISNNTSIDTRMPTLIERSYEITGSCKKLIFNENVSKGAQENSSVLCTQ
jgi:parallel beta-helix repeat protein